MQSRVKVLEKMEDGRDLREARHDALLVPADRRARSPTSIRVEGLKKAYGDHVVFPGVDLTVRRGEKIGIIGVNGAGKTTLLRMIAGELPHDGGTIKIGNDVKVGYYAQHHADTLDLAATVYEVVQRASPETPPARVRSILGAFMFSGDDIDKPVKVLSGGEKARVALARLLRQARQPAADGRADEPPRPRVVGEPRRVARRRSTARSCSSATTAA